ncbi:MAG: Uma2 family endonuclease [Armatimonadota bacterium]
MSSVQDRADVLTPEEFYRLYADDPYRRELVDGMVVTMSPPGPHHGRIDSRVGVPLAAFVRSHSLGDVVSNSGFVLRRDLVRAPDQAFVSNERIEAAEGAEKGYWEVAPDLAVEVVSPDDRRSELDRKIRDYLECGVRMVWIIDPPTRTVTAYRPEREPRVLSGDDSLDGEDVVPGFRLPLAELWPPRARKK